MPRLRAILWLVLLAVPHAAVAQEKADKVLREAWYVTRTETGKLGYSHLLAREVQRNGQTLIHTILDDSVSYLRSGDPFHDSSHEETWETLDGRVVELLYTLTLSKKQKLRLHGKVRGKELHLCVLDDQGQPTDFRQIIPWEPATIGLYAQETYFERNRPKPGESYVLLQFTTSVNRVLPVTYHVKDWEKTSAPGGVQELLRVEISYPKSSYLTPHTAWLDASGRIVKLQEEDSTMFGLMTRELSEQETAAAPFEPTVRDKDAPVTVDKPIRVRWGRPLQLRLRVAREGDDDPGTLFAQDGRQRILAADNQAVELLLRPRPPRLPEVVREFFVGRNPRVGSEYLESNFFIRSDDPLVKQYAQEALGEDGKDRSAMEQARRIKAWVRRKVKPNYEIAFATADEVARCPEGDCSEMGMLAAAMARSVGIPSRVVLGLVYDWDNHGFGGHLWTEMFVDGQWQTIDPTGVIDMLGAAYIKIAAYSLKDVLNPDELVEIRRAFSGPMRVEVLESR
ncbi:MAG: transglutaminase-like domain-containing protein [Gemmatales bacterium]|nr:transglutaminase-like domain-containing protein [Gemmatales bacterium]MDW8385826.1 transglutaminase-like domain-containing protein [Gemmatales bacterium]